MALSSEGAAQGEVGRVSKDDLGGVARLGWSVWSLLVWPAAFLWMLLVCVISFPVALFVPFVRWQHRLPARMLGCVPWMTGSRLRVRRHPAHDRRRAAVYVANHTSMIDGHVVLAAVSQPFCGIENEAHFHIPFYGWMMRLGGGIAVPKSPGGRLPGIIRQARDRVLRGLSILVFPEGGRTRDGKVMPFHRGGFFMARDLGLPVVPVGVRGLYHVLPRGRWVMRGGSIEVWLGPPVDMSGLSDAEVIARTEGVRQMLIAYVERGEEPDAPIPAPWQPAIPLPP